MDIEQRKSKNRWRWRDGEVMTVEQLEKANKIMEEIETLEEEIKVLTRIEHNTREKRIGSHRLSITRLFAKPIKESYSNHWKLPDGYWMSHDLDGAGSIILFDADEVKVLVDFKKKKVENLERELKGI